MEPFAVIVPAAGTSSRFAGGNKLLALLAGEPVLRRTVAAFRGRPDVACVIIAAGGVANDLVEAIDRPGATASASRVRFCRGGASRAESVRNALGEVPRDIAWVAVHDAARPLVSQQLIEQTFAAARRLGAAVPAMPVALTVKQADGPLPARVQRTIPRHTLWVMQTPQAMRRDALQEAFDACPLSLDQITDDAQVLELAGHEVWLIPGEERNLKITTAQDLVLAETLLKT